MRIKKGSVRDSLTSKAPNYELSVSELRKLAHEKNKGAKSREGRPAGILKFRKDPKMLQKALKSELEKCLRWLAPLLKPPCKLSPPLKEQLEKLRAVFEDTISSVTL